MTDIPRNGFAVVIDIDQYAGSFERELCAYCTGQLGDCQVGKEMQDLFNTEVNGFPFDNVVISEPDDHGCYRPCSIFPSPAAPTTRGQFFNSVAIFFIKKPKKKHIDIIKTRAQAYAQLSKKERNFIGNFNIKGFRLIENKNYNCITTI